MQNINTLPPLIPSPYHSTTVAKHEVETSANEHVTIFNTFCKLIGLKPESISKNCWTHEDMCHLGRTRGWLGGYLEETSKTNDNMCQTYILIKNNQVLQLCMQAIKSLPTKYIKKSYT